MGNPEQGGEPPCYSHLLDENGQVIERPQVDGDELEEETSAAPQPEAPAVEPDQPQQ
jgi:hypothetical protein